MGEITARLDRSNMNSEICFSPNGVDWAFKVTNKGIIFNKEKFPFTTADEFAKAFVDILEMQYEVKFEKRQDLNDNKISQKFT